LGAQAEAADKQLHRQVMRVFRIGDSVIRLFRRGLTAARKSAQERETLRSLSKLPNSVIEDLGFRRVDICGRPLPPDSANAVYGDSLISVFTPLEIYPAFIERVDTGVDEVSAQKSGGRAVRRSAAPCAGEQGRQRYTGRVMESR
jgi:hypothetical protein